ncbi:hypothetical protein O181_068931 [Austropuccinia psidii MF-1]|uniref:Uncharacterized protein n=1 Tax=Austropuccinia psidii MF-1 TaxID=1389203 RepID=A0A9Q3EVR7_9BASI|nr:hypothetical protein [Austropuccinia psidii MF-1]
MAEETGHGGRFKSSKSTVMGGAQRQTQRESGGSDKEEIFCHNFGSTDHYAYSFPKEKKKVYEIEKVPDEEFPTEDSELDSMGDAIREQSDRYQDPREEFLVEYQEETPLEIQEIQLEAGMP